MRITCQHPASIAGIPVILGYDGHPCDYGPGMKLVRKQLKMTVREFANACGISHRTAEGWEQGRVPPAATLNLLGLWLDGHG